MRNYFYILFLFFTLSNNSFGQEVVLDTSAKSIVLNDYELSEIQYNAWKSIQNNWLADDYQLVKAENKIKLNCKDCESFYVEVIFKINSKGKLEYYKLINNKMCGMSITKKIEIRMMSVFFKIDFPEELRNTVFRTRLGNSLKC